MLWEAFEDIVARGNKLRQEITKDVLNSKVVSTLASSPRLVNTVSQVIRSTSDVNKVLEKSVSEVLEFLKIPSCQQVKAYEKRIAKLEKQVNAATRNVMNGAAKAKPSKAKSPAKETAPKKVVTQAKPQPEPQPVARNPLIRETPVVERVIPTVTPVAEPKPAVTSSPVTPAAESPSVETAVSPSPVADTFNPDKY